MICTGLGGDPPIGHPCRHSGLLSALGLALADVVHEAQEPCSLLYAPETFMQLDQRLSRLEEQCVDALQAQGFPRWAPRVPWTEGLRCPPSWVFCLMTSQVVPGCARSRTGVLVGRWVGWGVGQGVWCECPQPPAAGPRSALRASCTCATGAPTVP